MRAWNDEQVWLGTAFPSLPIIELRSAFGGTNCLPGGEIPSRSEAVKLLGINHSYASNTFAKMKWKKIGFCRSVGLSTLLITTKDEGVK